MIDIESKLPHKYPVRFIKEVDQSGEFHSVSKVEFVQTPTLCAVVEAAAQNITFINSLYREFNAGVLASIKNVVQHNKLEKGVYRVQSRISAKLDNFCVITFSLYLKKSIIAEGEISIVMKERM